MESSEFIMNMPAYTNEDLIPPKKDALVQVRV